MRGYSDVLIGLQYGDEGKGKVIAKIVRLNPYRACVRFNGGGNAGHTQYFGEVKFVTHEIPSAILEPNMLAYIASGCVTNLKKLSAEVADMQKFVDITERFFISSRVQVVQPHNTLLDRIACTDLGTTGNGIGPAYADRAMRRVFGLLKNIQFSNILRRPEYTREIIIDNYEDVIKRFVDLTNEEHAKVVEFLGDIKEQADQLISAAHELKKYCCENPLWLVQLVGDGKNVLFEGAQSVGLDVVSGTVPYVTSSYTVPGAAYVGGDLPPGYHRKTFGVVKAIESRVGRGPFVSEFGGLVSEEYCMKDNGKMHMRKFEKEHYDPEKLLNSKDPFEIGIALRMMGDEYGATTGRPRRIGMLDLVQLRHACLQHGVDELYINKIDSLSDFSRTKLPGIPLVIGYELDGRQIDCIPTEDLRRVKPVVEYSPHIPEFSTKEYGDLPSEVRKLVYRIENFTECKVAGIGVGPEREQLISIPEDDGYGI